MAQFGSGRSIIAQNQSAVTDPNGNLIVSPDNTFTGSPLGVAALNQVNIGVPNGTFNLLPADPVGDITPANPLPYWDLYSDEGFVTSMSYDTATQTNSVTIDPTAVGTALGTAILKTRIPIISDDGLDVRHYVASSLVPIIKTAGADKWTATLTSQYLDTTGAAIGTPYVIGTIGERGTATVLASYTNASGAISTSAAELEIAYKVVVGTASPTYSLDIKSVLVATEYGVIGGGGTAGTGFIPLSVITAAGDLIKGAAAGSATVIAQGSKDQVLTVTGTALGSIAWQDLPPTPTPAWTYQEFTSSGTFTVPAGVSHVNVWATGGGQGGQSGRATSSNATAAGGLGGSGGRSALWALRRDIYVGDVATVVIGIGAGGTGGTAITFSKAAGATTQKTTSPGDVTPGNGGDTTFGTYFTVQGATTTTDTVTGFYGLEQISGTAPGSNGAATGGAGGVGSAHPLDGYKYAPFVDGSHFSTAGSAGATGSGSGGTGASGAGGAANSTNGFAGSGGGGGGGSAASSSTAGTGAAGGPGGGGSGGGASARFVSGASQTLVVTGGAGSDGQQWGAGGGAGGAATLAANGTANYASATITMTSGAGGAGKAGRLYVYWMNNV